MLLQIRNQRQTINLFRALLLQFLWTFSATFVCSGCLFAADVRAPVVHVRNFAVVNDHLLRGGQPEAGAFRELASNHVTMVLNLREAGAATEAERGIVEGFGMKYVNVPFPPTSAPSVDEVKRVLSLINPDDAGTIFVHCLRGKDRTGTVVACYRIQHDGWTPQRALAEARHLGMSHLELGMRSFVLSFHAVDLPASGSAVK